MATKKNVPAKAKKGGFDNFVETDELTPEEAATTPASAMTLYSDTPIINTDDVFIPKLRLAQGLTSEVQNGYAKPGQWLISGEDPMEKATIVPLMMNRRRELRDSTDTRTVHCRSIDSIHGQGDPGGECANCPMSKWIQGKGKNAKNKPPACTFVYSYIVYILETQSVAILEFSRTAISAGKMLNTMIMQRGIGKFGAQLTCSNSKGPRGTFYSPVVSGVKIPEKTLAQARAVAAEAFGK